MPKVSVLMPIYNTKEEYLRQSIESILNQTYTDFEFIILNDSPQNSTLDEIVYSYNDSRIKYFKNDQTLGISSSRNKLLDLATGDYIAVFDHDDISLPERLEKETIFLDNNKDIGVVSCNYELLSTNKRTHYPQTNLEIKKELLEDDVVLHTGMMVRKAILDKYNIRYEQEFSPAEDYMLCIRLMDYTMFHNLADALIKYRDNYSNTTINQAEKMADASLRCKAIVKKHYGFITQDNNCYWIKIFKYIPIFKVKKRVKETNVYLFGIIPLISITNYR